MPNALAWVKDVIFSCSMLRLRVFKETLMKGPGSWKNCNEQVISPRQLLTHVLSGLLFYQKDPTCQHFLEDALDLWGCQAWVCRWSEWCAGSITQWTCSWILFVAVFNYILIIKSFLIYTGRSPCLGNTDLLFFLQHSGLIRLRVTQCVDTEGPLSLHKHEMHEKCLYTYIYIYIYIYINIYLCTSCVLQGCSQSVMS